MNLIRPINLVTVLVLSAMSAAAQNAFLRLTAPSTRVLVNAQMQIALSLTDVDGTPLDTSGVTWSSSDSSVATVGAGGTVQGLFPGDISITATDSVTNATGSMLIHIVPSSILLRLAANQVHVGELVQVSASALDAAGNPVPGVEFQFRSGEPAVASIDSSGALNGVAEGFATIEARIPSITSDPALVATTQVHVLPALAYKIKKLISTDATSATTIAAYTAVSAVSPSEIASIVTLANGNQAAILIESGKINVLAVAGQPLPNAGRMPLRLDAISANSKGDVALLIQYPQQFCAAAVILFPHGQPEQELGVANCYSGIYPRSLAEDGSVLYRYNDQIYSASAASAPRLLFSIASQPAAGVRSVNDFAPSRAGTFILNTTLTSGAHTYLYFDGKSLSQIYKDGDTVAKIGTTSMDNIVGGADGTFYARINVPNSVMLVRIAPGPLQPVVNLGDGVAGGTVGWIDSIVDAGPAGMLVVAYLNTNNGHRSICVWNGKGLVEYVPTDGWNVVISGAIASNGSAIVSASIYDVNIPGLRSISSSGNQTMLMAAGIPFPQPAPAGVDWHFASRGGSASALPSRGTGDEILNMGNSPQPILNLGSQLPNRMPAISLGGVMANESGDMTFTAGFATGNSLLRYRSGKLETLFDSSAPTLTVGGNSLSGVNTYRGRYMAINNRGDVVVKMHTTTAANSLLVLFASDGPHVVAQLNTLAPGGGNFTNFQDSLSIDDNGRVLFIANTSDARLAIYFWDGKSIGKVIGIGDTGPSNLAVNELSNITGAGQGFLILLAFGGYQVRELRYFDGAQMRTLLSTDTTVLDGTGFSYFWANDCTLAANGDAHCMAATQDGGLGVYAHRTDGRNLIVARSRDQLPGGEWLIMPLSVSSSMNGEVYFTADVFLNGVESLALYEAIP